MTNRTRVLTRLYDMWNRKMNSTLFCTFGIHGRCVDLSREAFSRIADLDDGLTYVTVEVVG